ncbi:MAG: glycoside hydrolase family 18 protein [Tissierellia bacterium]|nr:glycoside hydrolase family 18 protein [Tissierellia bacterium]
MYFIHIKKFVFSVLIFLLVFSFIGTSPRVWAQSNMVQDKKIVGYYASWAAYSGFSPDQIDPTKLTHINYAFANISQDLKISLGDPYIDYFNIMRLNNLRSINPDIKILISVGGWTWSDKFSDVALTEESRTIFANSCLEFIQTYGFDGIDIDWEFPVSGGLPTNKYRPEDKENFTLLLRTIREKLDEQSIMDGKEYVLTIAGSAGTIGVDNLELGEIHQYIDFANIMTYDFHGAWDKYTDFNAPLYTNHDSLNYFKPSVDESIKSWINSGFPREKIVMGIPFSGKLYNNVEAWDNGLYQSFEGSSVISFGEISTKYLYNQAFLRHYHPVAMAPWLYNGTTFISYEDEESIYYKSEYIKLNGLGGAMIWELSEDPNRILLDFLYQSLQYENIYESY